MYMFCEIIEPVSDLKRCVMVFWLTERPKIPQATKDKAVELIRNQIKYRPE